MGIIGARGMGKTYSCKKYVLKQFFRNKKVFAWLRDNENSLNELTKDDAHKFFEDISGDDQLKQFFTGHKITVNNGTIFYDNKLMGYFMACSTFYKQKGNSYSDVFNIVYDEFIQEKSQVSRGNRALEFLNVIETIGRLRTDYHVLLTANALDKGDAIINALGINIKGFGYYVNRSKNVVLHYAENNKDFELAQSQSIAGQLINGTEFASNLLSNSFSSNNIKLYDIKPKGTNLLVVFKNSYGKEIRFDSDRDTIYVSFCYNHNISPDKKYCSRISDVDIEHNLAPSNLITIIKSWFGNNKIKFQSDQVYDVFMDIFLPRS